jgi:hypothetical protein
MRAERNSPAGSGIGGGPTKPEALDGKRIAKGSSPLHTSHRRLPIGRSAARHGFLEHCQPHNGSKPLDAVGKRFDTLPRRGGEPPWGERSEGSVLWAQGVGRGRQRPIDRSGPRVDRCHGLAVLLDGGRRPGAHEPSGQPALDGIDGRHRPAQDPPQRRRLGRTGKPPWVGRVRVRHVRRRKLTPPAEQPQRRSCEVAMT